MDSCPVCAGPCRPFDVVDFNKSCEEVRGVMLPPSGLRVAYERCDSCGFCFAPEIMAWPLERFEREIYNGQYPLVDPDYLDVRPRANAAGLQSLFRGSAPPITHLDFGGGSGLMSKVLREAGWQSSTYDPFADRGADVNALGRFNLVTAFEVFEHVPDVNDLMKQLKALLAPQGVVIFSTLTSDEDIVPGKPLTWWYASPRNGHISLFSKKSLATLARNHGFMFASFAPGLHLMFTQVPGWASHFIRVG